MKIFRAFISLIRFQNLIFILLTQFLFYYCVYKPLVRSSDIIHFEFLPLSFKEVSSALSGDYWLFLLSMASFFIAAGGYIINDYFDLQIDQLNKPQKVVVDKVIKRRWVIVWHWIFSLLGIFLSLMVSYHSGRWLILLVNTLCVWLLWLYSTGFKRKLLSGNIIISLLTAWVILVVFFFAGGDIFNHYSWFSVRQNFDARKFFKIAMLYAGFAFIISLVREVIKDIEDMYGDAKFNCKTMPIVWGIPVSKMFAAVWMAVAMISLLVIQFYAFHSARYWSAAYCMLMIVVPLGMCIRKLYKAKIAADYHLISQYLKWIMLAGILSMTFFKFNL